jgi:hypothetical protein
VYVRVDAARELAAVPAESVNGLQQDLDALRDKTLLHVDREQVAALRFVRPGASFEVRRESAPTRVGAYAWTLVALRGKRLAPEGSRREALGLDHPALEVTLLAADGKELDRLIVGPERGGKTYARAASNGRLVEIDPATLATLPKTSADAQENPASPAEAKAGAK